MKVAVFGGSGFLGSHLIDLLLSNGHTVLNIDSKANKYIEESKRNLTILPDTEAKRNLLFLADFIIKRTY